MPITLTTIPAGAPTDATFLRATIEEVQRYVNEATTANDRTSTWLKSVHVFRPDFQYALASKEVPMPGAHIFWNDRQVGRSAAAFYSHYQGNGPLCVPGLTRTIQIPEDIGSAYSVLVRASFVAYEYGGAGIYANFAPADPFPSDSNSAVGGPQECADFNLQINNDTPLAVTERAIFVASDVANANPYISRFYVRKQITMLYAISGTTLGGAGTHDIKIVCNPLTPWTSGLWKHILVTQGVMVARCRLR